MKEVIYLNDEFQVDVVPFYVVFGHLLNFNISGIYGLIILEFLPPAGALTTGGDGLLRFAGTVALHPGTGAFGSNGLFGDFGFSSIKS